MFFFIAAFEDHQEMTMTDFVCHHQFLIFLPFLQRQAAKHKTTKQTQKANEQKSPKKY